MIHIFHSKLMYECRNIRKNPNKWTTKPYVSEYILLLFLKQDCVSNILNIVHNHAWLVINKSFGIRRVIIKGAESYGPYVLFHILYDWLKF